ncbi:hypothetical protein PV325_011652, partial [Microctonus aethiopoides]
MQKRVRESTAHAIPRLFFGQRHDTNHIGTPSSRGKFVDCQNPTRLEKPYCNYLQPDFAWTTPPPHPEEPGRRFRVFFRKIGEPV